MAFSSMKSNVIFIKSSRNYIKISAKDMFDFFQVKTGSTQNVVTEPVIRLVSIKTGSTQNVVTEPVIRLVSIKKFKSLLD